MGGKQKRAAKYKKWMEAQLQLKQNASQKDMTSDGMQHDGSGDHEHGYQPIPLQVQQEVLKYRARKSKKHQRKTSWILRKLEHIGKSFDHLPTWPCTILATVILTIAAFFLIRNLIQVFVPSDASVVDRSPLYNGLRMVLPRPFYKFIRVVDYLFTSPVLSLEGINSIVYPPEEHGRHHRHQ